VQAARVRVVLVAHAPSIGDKPHRSTSTPANASLVQLLGKTRRRDPRSVR